MKLNLDLNKTFVVGDIHGCYYTLLDLLEILPDNANVIFTGDLLDKGKHSFEVVDLIMNNKNFYSVKGNHEEFFIKYIKDSLNGTMNNTWNTNIAYGGLNTIDSYMNKEENILNKHYDWIKNLPLYFEIDKFFITHGFGLPYYKRRKNKSFHRAILNNRILNSNKHRKEWEDNYLNYNIFNIFGHDDSDKVIKGDNYLGIDTGLIYDRKLTAVKLSTMETFEIKKNFKD